MLVRTMTAMVCVAACTAAWQFPVAPDAAAAGPMKGAGTYKGKTGQGRQIVFRMAHGQLDLRHFSIKLRCRDGSTLIDQESGFEPSALRPGGVFREYQYGSTDKVWFRGRANDRLIRGRVRVKDRWGHIRCDSHWVRFSAKRRG